MKELLKKKNIRIGIAVIILAVADGIIGINAGRGSGNMTDMSMRLRSTGRNEDEKEILKNIKHSCLPQVFDFLDAEDGVFRG